MSKIIRTEPGPILSKAVEYHGFVYLPGITARTPARTSRARPPTCWRRSTRCWSITAPTRPACCRRLIWVKHIKDRVLMNEIWTPWLPKDGAPVRACVQAEMAAPEVLVEIMVTACK